MVDIALQQKVSELTEEFGVPGVSVGVFLGGEEHYAFAGVTSVENPLPVDETTLFQFGSTGKTFTATAIMLLVESGQVDLDAKVRTYVPELRLKDECVAERVTVLQLLNHTAGWEGDMLDDTGDGDDALARYVERMARLEHVAPLGATVSYNNASLCLAGRIIEKVTGSTYEQAIRDLLLEPLGLTGTYFFTNEIMTRRFVVGHSVKGDGPPTVARPWSLPRSGAAAGGMSANARDQLAWARFHLGNGTSRDGTRLLSEESLRRMQQPTADMTGSALGDQMGISWMLAGVGGVQTVGHGGTTRGQHSAFVMVPERDFALISMTNCGPNGPQLNDSLEKWAMEHYLGVSRPEPTTVPLTGDQLSAYAGSYETIAAWVTITADDTGGLLADIEVKPDMLKILHESGEEVPDEPPTPLALLAANQDQYVIPNGPGKGMKGYFSRGADGQIDGVHFGGRMATRCSPVPA